MRQIALCLAALSLACAGACASEDPKPSGDALSASGDAEPKPKAAPPSPADQDPAHADANRLIMKMANDALAFARTGQGGEAWGLAAGDPSFAETQAQLKAFEGATLRFVVFELEGLRPSAYLRTGVVAFPDGRIAWHEVSVREGPASVAGAPTLGQAAPELNALFAKLVAQLESPKCGDLPTVEAADTQGLAPKIAKDFTRAASGLPAFCANPLLQGDAPWVPRVDDISIVLEKDGELGLLRTSMRATDGRLVLESPRWRAMPKG